MQDCLHLRDEFSFIGENKNENSFDYSLPQKLRMELTLGGKIPGNILQTFEISRAMCAHTYLQLAKTEQPLQASKVTFSLARQKQGLDVLN